jgi:hypothetical protein
MKEKGIMSRQPKKNEKTKKTKKNEKTDSSGNVIKHKAEASADETLNYWTAERKRDATPAKMPHVDTLDKGKEQP